MWSSVGFVLGGIGLLILSIIPRDRLGLLWPRAVYEVGVGHGLEYYWIFGLILSAALVLRGIFLAFEGSGRHVPWWLVALIVLGYLIAFERVAAYRPACLSSPDLYERPESCWLTYPGSNL